METEKAEKLLQRVKQFYEDVRARIAFEGNGDSDVCLAQFAILDSTH